MATDMTAPGFERIVPKHAPLDRIAYGLQFGEGPVWNARQGSLLWVDIVGDTIWKWIPGKGTEIFLRPSGKANGMTYDRQGRLVVAGWAARTVWRMEPDGSIVTLASHYQGKKINTPNDIGESGWDEGRHRRARLLYRPRRHSRHRSARESPGPDEDPGARHQHGLG